MKRTTLSSFRSRVSTNEEYCSSALVQQLGKIAENVSRSPFFMCSVRSYAAFFLFSCFHFAQRAR
jgi:hypothetical protein